MRKGAGLSSFIWDLEPLPCVRFYARHVVMVRDLTMLNSPFAIHVSPPRDWLDT